MNKLILAAGVALAFMATSVGATGVGLDNHVGLTAGVVNYRSAPAVEGFYALNTTVAEQPWGAATVEEVDMNIVTPVVGGVGYDVCYIDTPTDVSLFKFAAGLVCVQHVGYVQPGIVTKITKFQNTVIAFNN